jgi:hypothetical protein
MRRHLPARAQLPVHRASMARPAVPEAELRAIDYVPADAVGFQHLPQLVRYAVSGVLIGTEVAADAEPPVASAGPTAPTTSRQPGGGPAPTDTSSSRPAGGSPPQPVAASKRSRAGRSTGRSAISRPASCRLRPGGRSTVVPPRWAPPGRRRIADDPLDVLPRHLAAPVGGADASAWQKYQPGWAEETIVAALATPDRVRTLRAQRTATSRPALETADWYAVSLDAPVAAVQALGTDSRGQLLLAPATYPALVRRGASSPRSIRPPG